MTPTYVKRFVPGSRGPATTGNSAPERDCGSLAITIVSCGEGDDARSVVRYLLYNPVRAGLVRTAREYPWSGSLRFTLSELEGYAGSWAPEWKR